jgi:plastocyanin
VPPLLAWAAAAGAAAVLAGAPAVAAAPARDAAPSAQVSLRNIAFVPATVRIRRGQSVRWTWRDPFVLHDLKSVGRPRFAGETAKKTGTHTVRFRRAGRFRYECTLHPGMRGVVVVR